MKMRTWLYNRSSALLGFLKKTQVCYKATKPVGLGLDFHLALGSQGPELEVFFTPMFPENICEVLNLSPFAVSILVILVKYSWWCPGLDLE